MIHFIPMWLGLSILILLILAFIFGYFFIKRHIKKEKEKELINNEISQIGK